MTEKEKAKAYDNLIERLKNFQFEHRLAFSDTIKRYFPELAESEDERIRKNLIKIVNDHYSLFKEIDRTKTIAWLEKQGEQKPAAKVEPKFKVGDIVTNKKSKDTVKIVQILHDSYCYSGWDGAATIYSDFSISEQDDWELVELTACSEEGGSRYSEDDIAAEEKAEYNKGFECGKQRVLKYLEDFDLCKKPAWSEKDESYYNSALWHIKNSCGEEGIVYNWLKSLKDRVQPKVEWSEEDESYLNTTIAHLKDAKEFKKTAENCIDWLKSLRLRKQWKPLGKHLEALAMVINDELIDISVRDDLNNLFEQLKQL